LYTSQFGFKEKPFDLRPDPRFLYLSDGHKEALAHLEYGAMEGMDFVVITGDVGTGKTTIVNAFLQELNPDVKRVHLADPGSTAEDLYYLIKRSLNLPVQNISKGEILWALNDFMRSTLPKNERVLLIIDEAQRLSPDMLEEIRLLSNIETPEKRLFQIFLVGQEELNVKLQARELRQLRQRIGLKYDLRALNPKDTQQYITHRLHVAGFNGRAGRKQQLFSPGAVKAIYKFSKGYPRLINILCDNALVTAYAKDVNLISRKIIKEVIRDMEASYAIGQKRTRFKLAWIMIFILFLVGLILAVLTYGIYDGHSTFQALRQSDTHREITDSSGTAAPEVEQIKDMGTDSQDAVSVTEAQPETPPLAERNLKNAVAAKTKDTTQEIHEEVFFGFDSFLIKPEATETLKRAAEAIQRFPEAEILIEGHSDNVGDEQANRVMSQQRAETVKQWLMNHTGVEASRFIVKGWGPTRPRFSNDSPEGRRENRRVEIILQERSLIDNTLSAEPIPSHPKNSK